MFKQITPILRIFDEAKAKQFYVDYQLMEKGYSYLRPAIEDTPWNLQELQLIDPFGNRIVFFEKEDVN